MTDEWVKSLELDIMDCAKKMMMARIQLCQKETGEYDSTSLHLPYMVIALMLNRIFGRENGILYKLSWIPLIYYAALEGTIFNWLDIVSSSLSSCIASAQGGMNQGR